MLTAEEVFRKLGAISRQRDLVKASHLSEAAKAKLSAQLDAQARELEAQIIDPSKPAPKA